MLQSLMRMLLEITGALKISVTHNQFMVQSLMTMLFKMNNLPVDREISVGVPEPFLSLREGTTQFDLDAPIAHCREYCPIEAHMADPGTNRALTSERASRSRKLPRSGSRPAAAPCAPHHWLLSFSMPRSDRNSSRARPSACTGLPSDEVTCCWAACDI